MISSARRVPRTSSVPPCTPACISRRASSFSQLASMAISFRKEIAETHYLGGGPPSQRTFNSNESWAVPTLRAPLHRRPERHRRGGVAVALQNLQRADLAEAGEDLFAGEDILEKLQVLVEDVAAGGENDQGQARVADERLGLHFLEVADGGVAPLVAVSAVRAAALLELVGAFHLQPDGLGRRAAFGVGEKVDRLDVEQWPPARGEDEVAALAAGSLLGKLGGVVHLAGDLTVTIVAQAVGEESLEAGLLHG